MEIGLILHLIAYVVGALCRCLVQAGDTYQIDPFDIPCDSGMCRGPMEHCEKPFAHNRMATCRSCDSHCGKSKHDIPQGCNLQCAMVNGEVIPTAVHNKILQNRSTELISSMHSQCNEDLKKSLKEFADARDQQYNYNLSKTREKLSEDKDKQCNEALQNYQNKTYNDINNLKKTLFAWKCYGIVVSVFFPSVITGILVCIYRTKIRQFITACNMCSRCKPKQKKGGNKGRVYEESGTTVTSGSSKPLITSTENNHTNVDNREDRKAMALSNGTTEH